MEPKAAGKSRRLTEHAGPVTQHPPLLGAVGGGRLLKGLVKLAVRRQQDRDPLHLHRRDAWGPGKKGWGLGEGSWVLPSRAQRHGSPEPRGSGEGLASCATFHVHLGGLHNFLVDHKLGELPEEHGTGVDEDWVVEEGGLRERRRVGVSLGHA